MDIDTNIIDMTDRTATEIMLAITDADVRAFNRGFNRAMREDADGLSPDALRDLFGDSLDKVVDDTVRIPTYMGEPMLPPVPAGRHRAPGQHRHIASHRVPALLTALTAGGLIAPLIVR